MAAAVPALAWAGLVGWEAAMARELGVDGGSNRGWAAVFEQLPAGELAQRVMVSILKQQEGGGVARQAFAGLLDAYLEQHPQVFEQMRAAHRPPNAELLQLVRNPAYSTTPRGRPLRWVGLAVGLGCRDDWNCWPVFTS